MTLTKVRIGGSTSVIRDLAGQRFGRLVATVPVRRAGGKIIWHCRCDCGRSRETRSQDLLKGAIRYCHACRPRSPMKAIMAEREACALLAASCSTGLKAAALIRARCAP